MRASKSAAIVGRCDGIVRARTCDSMFRSSAIVLVTIFFGISCASAPKEESGRATSATTVAEFVGCRPSAGECSNSCPDHRSSFLEPDARCPGLGDPPTDTGACLCGGGAPSPDPIPPRGSFVGCRPSAGECAMSCSNRRGSYVADDPACPGPGDPEYVRGGCYCD